MMDVKNVVIVGGGFSGLMTAYNLFAMAKSNLNITVVEKENKIGLGLAYSTNNPHHLLNVPASNMSALPQEPAHFVTWLKSQKLFKSDDDFQPRLVYGNYLQEFSARLQHNYPSKYSVLRDEAVACRWLPKNLWEIRLLSGKTLECDVLVLASGHLPTERDEWGHLKRSSSRFISNLWTRFDLREIDPQAEVLILGTGLSMVDAVVALKNQNHKGLITAFSRRGLVPAGHRPKNYDYSDAVQALLSLSQRDLLRELRKIFKEEARVQQNWRPLLDSLRPYTNKIWQGWSQSEKRRFLRHLRPYWEVHRHRMAPEIEKQINESINTDQLRILKGRFESAATIPNGFEVKIKGKNQIFTLNPQYIIDCRGPAYMNDLQSHPLLKSLLNQRILEMNPWKLGLYICSLGTKHDSNQDGTMKNRLFLLGALRRGEIFETTAVPELRQQVLEVAKSILNS